MIGKTDQDQLLSELSARWLRGLSPADYALGQELLRDLISDWITEANASSTPDVVIDILRDDLASSLEGLPPQKQFRQLRLNLLKRQVSNLSAGAFQLGKAVVDGQANGSKAQEAGLAFLHQAEQLSAEIEALDLPGQVDPLKRELAETLMDALYAVEGEAMSLRLSRYLEDRPAG